MQYDNARVLAMVPPLYNLRFPYKEVSRDWVGCSSLSYATNIQKGWKNVTKTFFKFHKRNNFIETNIYQMFQVMDLRIFALLCRIHKSKNRIEF